MVRRIPLVSGGWMILVLGASALSGWSQDLAPSSKDSSPPAQSQPSGQDEQKGAKGQDPAGQEKPPQEKPSAEKPPQEPAQETGEKDLEKAVELKAQAKTTRDLDEVVALCETAIEKGLDDKSKKLAEAMLKSTLFDHAKQLSERIFEGPRDSRWRFLRREAITRLEKVVKIDPQMVEAHLMLARLAMLPGGDLDTARAAIAKAIEFATNDNASLSEALLLRAGLAEDEDSQLADLNQAIIIDPSNTKALVARGQYHYTKQSYSDAVADFRLAMEQGGEDAELMPMLIQSLIAADQLDEANQEIEKALAKNADDPALYRMRAQIRLQQEKPDDALADIETVLKKNENDIDALMLKTSILYDQKNYDAALQSVEKVLQVQPGLVRGILMRSMIFAGKQDFDKAIKDIKDLADFAPDNQTFRLQLALFYNAAKKSNEAVELYSAMLEDDPENEAALRGRGDAFLSLGEHAKAIQDYEQAIESQKDDPDAGTINNLAWVLATSPKAEIRDGKRSIELGLRACELTEYKESYAVSTLAAAYAETGDFEKARELSSKAVGLGEQEKSDTLENLRRELESYQKNKPWRELLSEGLTGPEGELVRDPDHQPQDAGSGDDSEKKESEKTPDKSGDAKPESTPDKSGESKGGGAPDSRD